jgi:hypothetical protein
MKNVVFWDVTLWLLKEQHISEEHISSIIRVTRIGELGTALAVTSNLRKLRRSSMYFIRWYFFGA